MKRHMNKVHGQLTADAMNLVKTQCLDTSEDNVEQTLQSFKTEACHEDALTRPDSEIDAETAKLLEPKVEVKEKKVGRPPVKGKIVLNPDPEPDSTPVIDKRKIFFQCPHCDRKCQGKAQFNGHLRKTHKIDVPVENARLNYYTCHICNTPIRSKVKYERHVERHKYQKKKETEQNAICDICGKGFATAGRLQRHNLNVHGDGEKRYKCHLCPDVFKYSNTLQSHMRKAHGEKLEKPFVCELCGKTFSIRYTLKEHVIFSHGKQYWQIE